ncbi:hypothetical protein K3495_g2822 [Podosphaera aphanis]|nr:hypothetical protein K3495_g2822 [Podosphaera aphanis]
MLSPVQRNCGAYKRELFAIIEFTRKYSYIFRTKDSSTIYTDHRPLTYFLEMTQAEGIYARWTAEICMLNVSIEYIQGPRNKVADALFRTIFLDPNCKEDEFLRTWGEIDTQEKDPIWKWKDGKGGYEELLKQGKITLEDAAEKELKAEISCNEITIYDSTRSSKADRIDYNLWADLNRLDRLNHPRKQNEMEATNAEIQVVEWNEDEFFGDVYSFITFGRYPIEADQLARRALQRKCQRFKILGDALFCLVRGEWKRCVR